MKSPILKDTFREIKKSFSRFISIFAISAIGVAFFAGISASAPDMKASADAYFDEYNLMDFRILCNFGITENDVREIRKIEGLSGVYATYSQDVIVTYQNNEYVLKLHGMDIKNSVSEQSDYINQVKIVNGRLPEKSGELVIEKGNMVESPFHIGDTITIHSGTSTSIEESMKKTSYTIVGEVETPYYLSYQKGSSNIGAGTVNYFAYIPDEDFNSEFYTEVFITVEGAKKYNSYDEEYFDFISDVETRLENLGFTRAEIRKKEILDEANKAYNDGLNEYEEGLETFNIEIEKAEKALEDAQYELLSGEMELNTQKSIFDIQIQNYISEIENGKKQIETYQKYYDDALARYEENSADALESLRQNQEQLELINQEIAHLQEVKQLYLVQENIIAECDEVILNENGEYSEEEIENANIRKEEAQQEVLSLIAQYGYVNSNAIESEIAVKERSKVVYQTTVDIIQQGLSVSQGALETARVQLEEAKKQVREGEKQLSEARSAGEIEFAKAEAKLEQGRKDLENGKIELETKRAEGQQELEDAWEELVKAKYEIDKIEDAKWYILNRKSHYSYVDYEGAADRMEAISKVFPVFFFLVAALVALTTMTRMVDEKRNEIGTMKALGYSNGKIAFKFVSYALIASFTGSLFGLMIGMIVFPFIIYTAWNMMYILPDITYTLQWKLMLMTTIIAVSSVTLATIGACYKELIETPSLLMRPKAPKLGKKIILEKITFIWNRLSFTNKCTARNLFRYKKRFFMTVIGISGCTALLVAGFGIKDSIGEIVETQYGKVFKYSAIVSYEEKLENKDKAEALEYILSDSRINDATSVYMNSASISFDGHSENITLTVTNDPTEFKEFVSLHDRLTGEEYTLSNNGIILSERIATRFKIQKDDIIELTVDGVTKEVVVEAISENYINHYAYMTENYFKSTFNYTPVINNVFVSINEAEIGNENSIAQSLLKDERITTVSTYNALKESFESMIQSLNIIVVILIISAGALAFVVLYNLTNVNISERLREIATLKVLGFYDKEVSRYVYSENVILTVIGSFFGVGLGALLHHVIMVVVELDYIMFGRNINTISFIYSIIITVFFSLFVNKTMNGKMKKIPMVESLKSVE